MERKFTDGQRVIVTMYGHLKVKFIVKSATETISGWKYQLAFPKMNGEENKRKGHRFFYESSLVAQ